MEREEREMSSDLSYLAGIIDSEGTIRIGRLINLNRKASYQQRLHVSNTDLRLINWLIERFGGSMPTPRKFSGNCKDGYTWSLGGYKSYKVIKKVQPYLLLKREQANLAIKLWEKVSRNRYSSYKLPLWKGSLAKELYNRCKALNAKGKNNEQIEKKEAFSARDNIIYLSGIVDGDGCISIGRQMFSVENYGYYQRIQVINTNIILIEWLVENFGGKVPKVRHGRRNHKSRYDWQLSGFSSYKLTSKVLPYLVVKREQAECAVLLYNRVSKFWYGGSKPMPDYKRKLAEELYQRCRKLNKRGRDK